MPQESSQVKSLWGELPDVSALVPPIVILKQQGALLSKATKGLLTVSTSVDQANLGGLQVTMYLVATALNNYRFQVLRVLHGVELYPARVKTDDQSFECEDQEAFEIAVEQVLQSDRVRKAIAGLLAQMRSN